MSPNSVLKFLAVLASIGVLLAGPAAVIGATPTDVSPAQPRVPDRTFNVREFGAVADGHTSDQAAFQRAIAAVEKAGGGTLVVSAGQYFTGPLELCSNLNLHLEANAHLRFSTVREDYTKGGRRLQPLVAAKHGHDIVISGAGVIDGQGQAWWAEMKPAMAMAVATKQPPKPTPPRPWMVVFEDCQRVRLEGVTLLNSPMFQCALTRCEDVTIDGVSVFAPNLPLNHAFNTDGIDPIGCRRVLITHCYIDTGDDCIALKASPEAGPVSDVLITDCHFRNGHGCSIGSGTAPGVRNVTVRRCTFETTETGIHIKTARDRGGVVENLYCTDLVMKRVPFPIALSCYYPGTPKPDQRLAQPVIATTPVLRDITIRNLTATLATNAGLVLGLPEKPIEILQLDNVEIQADKGLRLADVKGIVLTHTRIVVPTGEPLIEEQGVSDIHVND